MVSHHACFIDVGDTKRHAIGIVASVYACSWCSTKVRCSQVRIPAIQATRAADAAIVDGNNVGANAISNSVPNALAGCAAGSNPQFGLDDFSRSNHVLHSLS